jgi:hypothetical protein
VIEAWADEHNMQHTTLYCPVPLLSTPLDCAEAESTCRENCDSPGWFYCEDRNENFEGACDPNGPWAGIDEDLDDLTDCGDPDCWRCKVCEDVPGVDPALATRHCTPGCRFNIRLTRAAKDLAWQRPLRISCFETLGNADANCLDVSARR